MNGHVFECYEEQADRRQYAKTLEALEGHVKKTMKYAEDLSTFFGDEMTAPEIERPEKPGADADEVDEAIWKEELKEHVKQVRVLKGNLATMMAVIWGQCSEAMKSKLKSHDEYKVKYGLNDCLWILKEIKAVTLQFDAKRNAFISAMDTRANFLNCRQRAWQSADLYLEELKGWADNLEYHGGTVAESHTLVDEYDEDGLKLNTEERKAIARDRTLGVALIRGADPTRYGTLIVDLANQYAMGVDNYPADITSAYSLLVNYKTKQNKNEHIIWVV